MGKSPKAAASSKATSPKTRARGKGKEKAKTVDGPLQRSFQVAKPADVGRAQQSGFVTYLRSAMKGKSELVCNQATDMLAKYKQMTNEEKKNMVCTFYKQGGKRPGLTALVAQTVSVKDKANQMSWKGYATFGKLLILTEVPLLLKPTSPPKPRMEHNQNPSLACCCQRETSSVVSLLLDNCL